MHPAALLLETIRAGSDLHPDARRAEWVAAPDLTALVAFEGCALFLHRRLAAFGVRDTGASGFGLWLARTAVRESARAMLVEAEGRRIAALFQSRGIPHILLKGVARRLARGLLPSGDARTTNDVDVLVPSAVATDVMQILRELGYRHASKLELTPEGHYHLPPVVGEGAVAVEIHTSISRRLAVNDAWRRFSSAALEIRSNGITVRIPSLTDMLWHAVIHGVEREAEAFRLRYLLDAVIVLERADLVDWNEIDRRLHGDEVADARMAGMWLATAAWLADREIPLGVSLPGANAVYDLRRTLEWRFDVLRRAQGFPRLGERLLVEGSRGELSLPVEGTVAGASVLQRWRRRMLNHVARVTYLAWRGTRTRPRPPVPAETRPPSNHLQW